MTVQGGIVEYVAPGDFVTFTVGATPITGGQMVKISANRTVIPTAGTAEAKVIGVALYNGAVGDLITIATDGVWPLTASGAIAFGDDVTGAAAGAVITLAAAAGATAADINNARNIVGMALEAITGAATGRVKLMR